MENILLISENAPNNFISTYLIGLYNLNLFLLQPNAINFKGECISSTENVLNFLNREEKNFGKILNQRKKFPRKIFKKEAKKLVIPLT